MARVARLTDKFEGTCKCHPPLPPIPMTGEITSCSLDAKSEGLGVARIGDIVTGLCGHTGTIITGSTSNKTNGKFKALLGSQVEGCLNGTIISGASTHFST